ncbi:MAG TPA: hypothetical protein VJ385_02620 [Fibrobacteria bacterium]|nr:hypothetical protein [Fibrobacteria bacterium]
MPKSQAPAPKRFPASKIGPRAGGKSFGEHMELVKVRLASGYYGGKNVDEALSDRLTGYFDGFA